MAYERITDIQLGVFSGTGFVDDRKILGKVGGSDVKFVIITSHSLTSNSLIGDYRSNLKTRLPSAVSVH